MTQPFKFGIVCSIMSKYDLIFYVKLSKIFVYVFKGERLLLTSNGIAKEFHEECMGFYELDGGFSNGKPTYKHDVNDRYIFCSPKLRWSVSKAMEIRYYIIY